MTIGPDFVYLAIPRTASQTLTHHFLPKYGGVMLAAAEYHRMDVPLKHADKFTFTVVRNPYDRMLSLWRFMKKFSDATRRKVSMWSGMTPAEFASWCREYRDAAPQWKSQSEFLSRARVDRALKFEDLEVGLRSLPFVDEFEMPLVHGATKRPPIEDDLTPEFVAAVNGHSGPDFERFGYEMR